MVLIRSVSGVRGITGEDITEELAYRYGRVFGAYRAGDLAVGLDSRAGGAELGAALARGLTDGGSRVLELGVVPTPTVGITVRLRGLSGGVVVTASHNPEEYNGLKFFSDDGVFLDPSDAERLFEETDAWTPAPFEPGGESVTIEDAIDRHIELVLGSDFVDVEAVRTAAPRVAVDCVNAAGSVILPELLRRIGCDVIEINTKQGGGFPRGAEPLPENLAELCDVVKREGAAAGLACDPDADRLAIVDGHGTPVGEEMTLALASRVVLERRPGPVVANVSTSRMLDDLAAEFGVPIHRSRVGEINVVAKMREVSAVVGGEGNGGVILPDVHMGRDASSAAALIMTGLARAGSAGMDGLLTGFTRYAMVKRKTALDAGAAARIVESMTAAFPDGEPDLTDGAKMCWPDRWVHVRMSGTEPVARIIAEAETGEEASTLIERAREAVSGTR